jgi:flagellar biosynthesis protein FlhA
MAMKPSTHSDNNAATASSVKSGKPGKPGKTDALSTFASPDTMMAVGVIAILAIMIVPVNPFFMDLLISLGIAASVIMMVTAVYVRRALDFSSFPTLLLIITLFRLSLNVASTRAILIRGSSQGTAAAGEVIHAFGEFVVGGNYAVGIVVFAILVVINFIVITKGAGRVAEVAARFTLDALPGKQMAIDADLNAGVINEEEARKRRGDVAREADFYGAMDGASKFVRGDAIAGILIVFINVIGGIIIGTVQQGMSIGDAAQVFTLLTIGDGLVTQIPALLVSTAAGIIVTRTGGSTDLGTELNNQVLSQPKSLYAGSGVMLTLALMPGLPVIPFLILGGGLAMMGNRLKKKAAVGLIEAKEQAEKDLLKKEPEKIENLLGVDPLELEVGYGLVNLVDGAANGDLLERITGIRKQFALEMGIVVPPLRIRDNLELKPGDYQVLLKGVSVATGSLMVGHLMAMDPGNVTEEVKGIPTKEPAFGLDAMWIAAADKDRANYCGYTVVDLSTVIATHLTEVIRQNSAELLGRQELQTLLDGIKQSAPKVIEDLIPAVIPVGTVLKVLKNLLKESVSIRDLRTILEALGEMAPYQKDASLLTEHARTALARSITKKLVGFDGQLTLLTLDKSVEETFAGGIIQTDQGPQLSLDPEFVRQFVSELNDQAAQLLQETNQAVVLCSPVIRMHVKQLIDRFIPNITVLSHNELAPSVNIRSFGTVRLAYAS